jgi:hypothetical protein
MILDISIACIVNPETLLFKFYNCSEPAAVSHSLTAYLLGRADPSKVCSTYRSLSPLSLLLLQASPVSALVSFYLSFFFLSFFLSFLPSIEIVWLHVKSRCNEGREEREADRSCNQLAQ